MGYKKILLMATMIICLLLSACAQKPVTNGPDSTDKKVVIYTSIYPLYDFAKNIGGEHVEVINLIPAGAEPHSWEPSPKDIAKLYNADMFIFSGAGLEPYVDKIASSFDENKPVVVDSSKNVSLNVVDGHSTDNTQNAHTDPHIWLDPQNAKIQVKNITNALKKCDPKNAEDYQNNSQEYLKKLDNLDQLYQNTLATVPIKKFITSHAAFGYLANRYGLEQISIRGLSPEVEPSPARLAEIVEVAKKNNIKYIFFENMVNPKVSRTLADEIGGGTLILNPIASITDKEFKEGKDYITIMQENLNNLTKALGGSNEK